MFERRLDRARASGRLDDYAIRLFTHVPVGVQRTFNSQSKYTVHGFADLVIN